MILSERGTFGYLVETNGFIDDLLGRLSRSLPNAVDSYTPEGRLPTQASPAS
jgi:uncharacterized protein YidB (DUF937 family)